MYEPNENNQTENNTNIQQTVPTVIHLKECDVKEIPENNAKRDMMSRRYIVRMKIQMHKTTKTTKTTKTIQHHSLKKQKTEKKNVTQNISKRKPKKIKVGRN